MDMQSALKAKSQNGLANGEARRPGAARSAYRRAGRRRPPLGALTAALRRLVLAAPDGAPCHVIGQVPGGEVGR